MGSSGVRQDHANGYVPQNPATHTSATVTHPPAPHPHQHYQQYRQQQYSWQGCTAPQPSRSVVDLSVC
jgi:hypothetical protein